jgi:membrane-bound ClpP family serine protease
MTVIAALFAAGILLLAVEVLVPGGVLGVAGGIFLLVGVILAFEGFGASGGALASGLALLAGATALYLELILLPRSRLAKKLSLSATVDGRSQPPLATASVVGRRGRAVTTLAPSGFVEVDGRRYEAFARDGHVRAGTSLEVIGLDSFRLIVSTLPSQSTP